MARVAYIDVLGKVRTFNIPGDRETAITVRQMMHRWVDRLAGSPTPDGMGFFEAHPEQFRGELARTRLNEAADLIQRQAEALDRGDTVNADEAQIAINVEIDRALNILLGR